MEGRGDISARDLGRAVREARRAKGYRQADVAAAAGVGVRFVGDLERGKETARLDHALRVARVLGVKLSIVPPVASHGHE